MLGRFHARVRRSRGCAVRSATRRATEPEVTRAAVSGAKFTKNNGYILCQK